MRDFDPNDEAESHHLLEALWLHQQHHVRDDRLLQSLLSSKVGHAAMAAKTVKHFWDNVDVKGATKFAAPAASHVVKYAAPKHLKAADKKIYKDV